MPEVDGAAWRDYVRGFHDQRPGITEEILTHASDGTSPYQWVVEAVGPGPGPVLDLACGSGPLGPVLANRGWIGADVSAGELSLATRHGAGPVILSDAVRLPLADASAGSVVCSMALMVVQPLDACLSEVARVLRPGGTVVALLPSDRPLTASDTARYTRLLLALRTRRIQYPNDDQLDRMAAVMGDHGLRVLDDRRRRFSCPITSPTVGVMCVRSLYLPDVDPPRLAAGERVARGWVGTEIGLPLRRVVAVRDA